MTIDPTPRCRSIGAALLALAVIGGASPAAGQAPPPTPAPAAPAPVVSPKLISDATVPYPEGATGDATVVLTLTINEDGSVRQAVPVEANEPFSMEAVSSALGWRFEPALRDGKPIAAKIRFEVVFHAPPPPEEPVEPQAPAPAPAAAAPKKAQGPAFLEVEVRGDRAEPSRTVSLSRAEVRQIPGTFGDPFRAIEIMPGVTPIVSGLPFFFIRGAPPGDVGYFLDGIKVPLLFHVGVGPSVVNPGIVERVDLYPGGYPARFGRFSGGIVAGETTQPMRDLPHGEFNLRLFDAGAMVETPFANGRGTVLAGGRYSYTGAMLSLVQSNAVLNYWDYQTRATYDLTPKDTIGVFAFGSYDYLGQKAQTQTLTVFGTEFHRVDLRYDHRLGADGTVRFAVTGGYDLTRLPDDRFLRSRGIGARTELTYRLAPAALMRAGADVQIDAFDVDLGLSGLNPAIQSAGIDLFPTRTDTTAGVRADVVLAAARNLEITPGVRLDGYSSQGATAVAVDPRLSTKLHLSDRWRVLSAMGIAQQPPAFIVPIPGFQPGGLNGGLQRALQESAGIETDLDDSTTASATVFHNAFFNMSDPLGGTPKTIGGCPPGGFPTDTLAGDRGSQVSGAGGGSAICSQNNPPGKVLSDGRNAGGGGATTLVTALETRTMGTSYGLELFLKRRLTSRIGGFFSYTLSRSIRFKGPEEFTATYDRTHVVNAALAYNLGRNWRAGTRVVFYTGLPKAPDPTDPGSTRLSPFFRIDLRVEKRWQLGQRTWISVVAEWMNATLSKEAVSTSCTLQGCQTQDVGPITIPSLGLEGGF